MFTQTPDEAFYLGVDAVPGHVAAGLVLDRPDDVRSVIGVLDEHRTALIAGPSGAGKSALAWLSAEATRHTIRWLRVRVAGARDVAALLRYAAAHRPTLDAPIGFVVDDVGSGRRELWDALVRESRHRPGLLVLGTVREEDLDLLEEASPAVLVRPFLGERLAEAIWRELLVREQTTAAGWREAFEASDGLLLEYLHLLTTGDRLATTVRSQVNRRLREHRDLELRVLRISALAAVHGGQVALDRLRRLLEATDEELQRALARLLREHLLQLTSVSTIGGLHQLRSEAIADAAHEFGVPPASETSLAVLQVVHADDIAAVTASLLGQGVPSDPEAGGVLTERLSESPSPDVLIACLDGLREAGVTRHARKWLTVMGEEELPPGQQESTAFMALTPNDLPNLAPSVQAALPRLRTVELDDPRGAWVQALPEQLLRQTVSNCAEIDAATEVLEAFNAMKTTAPVSVLAELSRVASTPADLPRLGRLIGAARAVRLELADDCVTAAGGSETILERTRMELPWVTSVECLSEGQEEVQFTWLLADEAQGDAHDSVVELCRLMASLFPSAMTFGGSAVDASGATIEYADLPLADKRIPRDNLPAPVEVRWNRTMIRRFAQAAAPSSRTDRLAAEADLVRRTWRCASEFAERWIRGQPPSPEHDQVRQLLVAACLDVPTFQRVPDDPSAGIAPSSDEPQAGAAASVCHSICANALPRLISDPTLALGAFFKSTIREQLLAVGTREYWGLIHDPPLEDVARLSELALHLYIAINSRVALAGAEPSSRLRRAARRSGLRAIAAVAEVASEDAAAEAAEKCHAVEGVLEAAGISARIVRVEEPHLTWAPHDDLLAIVEAPSILWWWEQLATVVDALAETFGPLASQVLVPVRDSSVVPRFAMRGPRLSNGAIVPHEWRSGLEAVLPEQQSIRDLPTLGLFDDMTASRATAAAIAALEETRDLLPPESTLAEEVIDRFQTAYSHYLAFARNDETGLLGWAAGIVETVLENAENMAATLARAGRGEIPELDSALGAARTAIAEWDIDSAAAVTMAEALLMSHEHPPAPTD